MGNSFSKAGAFFFLFSLFCFFNKLQNRGQKKWKEKGKESNSKGKVAWNLFLLYLRDLRHPRCLPGVSHQAVLARGNNPRLAFVGGLRKNKNNNKWNKKVQRDYIFRYITCAVYTLALRRNSICLFPTTKLKGGQWFLTFSLVWILSPKTIHCTNRSINIWS